VSFSQDSASRNGGIGDVYFQDGYKLISAEQLVGALDALNEREISFRAFRAYLGCFELVAIREAAERSNARLQKTPQRRFLRSDLAHILGAKEGTTLGRELSSLKVARLLTFTESAIDLPGGTARSVGLLGSRGGSRLIPVPRQVLKFLASCCRPALAKTVVAYLLRGLALDRSGKIRSAGTIKISWICKLCHISERAARAARAELIRLGWITKDTGSFQRKLNRDGAYFVINSAWCVPNKSAPLKRQKCTEFAPPREKQETPNGSKDQKPAPTVSGVHKEQKKPPTLRDIRPEDLRHLSLLEELYRQAVSAAWFDHCEASIQNFVCAALRATRSGGRVGAIFVGIVKNRLWHHITQEQESRALAALNRFRETHPEAFSVDEKRPTSPDTRVSKLIGSVLQKSDRLKPHASCQSQSDTLKLVPRNQSHRVVETALQPASGSLGMTLRPARSGQAPGGDSPRGGCQKADCAPGHMAQTEAAGIPLQVTLSCGELRYQKDRPEAQGNDAVRFARAGGLPGG
jgi:hypothetical protein